MITNVDIEREFGGSVVKPTKFSHGTQEVLDLDTTGDFYTEFLGVGWHRQGKVAGGFSSGGPSASSRYVACISLPSVKGNQTNDYRWVLAMESAVAVEEAREKAIANAEKYGVRSIGDVVRTDDGINFMLSDLNSNWWVFEFRSGGNYDEYFDAGDIASI